ncbi:GH92 family glycosyl hydrolase [Parafilimonas sp.]|uniref:GH92 family glycosyl hydrolase n=1 Tax=Parafilimonas sp. TaxID=1969739 RepID=UPI0039E5FF0F
MKYSICKKLFALFLLPGFAGVQNITAQKAIDFVDPFIGTSAHGHVYPGATVPFGMIQLSPDNGKSGWDWCSGYHYSDSVIAGFSHTHLSGTGIGDLADISVLPMVHVKPSGDKIVSAFSHSEEEATPGYYSVLLKTFGIKAAFTATENTGFHCYTFPEAKDAIIRFDLGFAINWDKCTAGGFRKINDTTFAGYRFSKGWAPDQKVFFAVSLSKPVKAVQYFADGNAVNGDSVTSDKAVACLLFDTKKEEKIVMKVALSYADEAGALAGLKASETISFAAAKTMAANAWEKELSRVKVTGDDMDTKKVFYTALYHAFEAPVRFDDVNGNYKGADGLPKKAAHPIYTLSSLWDVFRAESPLFTLLQPQRVPDIINSYYDFYTQHGLLPVWDLQFNETNCMTGYHCIPIVADAILKDFKGINTTALYEAMKKSSMQNIRGADFYREYGYLPQDKMGSSVTITLEYAYDDWCIAQVAKKLGYTDDYNYYMKRAASWKNVFDPSIGFARAKNADGSWVTPFDPYFSEHDEHKAMFTEGNAWQHSWFVPQDVYGLIKAFGGTDAFVSKLDSLFTVSSQLKGGNTSPDISGLIGQYAHGNEPSHHIAYLYAYAGQQYKTAARVRNIMQELYTAKTDGLCGNEDCGQMSAWYVWSALGFYPVNAASGEYVFGSPVFKEVTLTVANGKKLTIKTINNAKDHPYIQSIKLNGKPYDKASILHATLMQGGVLEFVMGAVPNRQFAVDEAGLPGRQ